VTLFRAATGEALGAQGADMIGPTMDGSRLILMAHTQDGCECLEVTAVDASTGRFEQRSLPMPPDVSSFWTGVDGSVEAYGTSDEHGMVRIYNAASGNLVDHTSDGATLTWYGRPGMTPQWTYTFPDRGRPWPSAGPCGWAICAGWEDQTVLLQPSTGRPRLTTTDKVVGTVGDGAVLALRAHPPKIGVPASDDVRVLDPDTGGITSTVPMAQPLEWRHSGGRALLLQRVDPSAAIVEVDASGRTRVLGRVEGASFCKAWGTTLACRYDSGRLLIWTMPLE
jgi:hypothetical protein